jgi:uncharacterized protein (TIGR03086 family)
MVQYVVGAVTGERSAICAHDMPAASGSVAVRVHGSSESPYAVPEEDIRHDAPVRNQSTTATVRKVELILAASAEFERVVRQLPVDSWDLPTPSQISVRDLVEHVVVGNRFTSLLLGGVGREQARNMLTDDQLGDDPDAAVAESSRQQAEAFAAAPPEQPVPGPNGDVPAEAFLRFRLVDLVVHAWDLLRAAGLDETLDPPVVAGLSRVVEPHLDDMLAFGAYGEGPSDTLPPDASQQTRLLDWFGRRP